jgi:hypothetical protein
MLPNPHFTKQILHDFPRWHEEETVKIFISHKMPTDTKAVAEFGQRLALYGGQKIEITHAGLFAKGADFKVKIEAEIVSSDLFLLFLTNSDYDWTYCLVECGLFRATMLENTWKRLVVIHSKGTKIPAPLTDFNAVTVDQGSISELLSDIYLRDPWSVKPDLPTDDLEDLASKLVSIFHKGGVETYNFDLVPNFSIELEYTDETVALLHQGRVPEKAIVLGSQNWQTLFGREPDTGAWDWSKLVENWENRSLYEFEIATMIADAAERDAPKGCYLRRQNDLVIYRLSLRRFERVANAATNRFFFTAAPMDVESYWLPRGSTNPVENKIFHFINISWFMRRRLIEIYYIELLDELSHSEPDTKVMKTTVRNIYHEIIIIEIQAVIRGVDSPRSVIDTLGVKDDRFSSKQALDANWLRYKAMIFAAVKDGNPDYKEVARAVFDMSQENELYYKSSAAAYAVEAGKLAGMPEPS